MRCRDGTDGRMLGSPLLSHGHAQRKVAKTVLDFRKGRNVSSYTWLDVVLTNISESFDTAGLIVKDFTFESRRRVPEE